MLHLMFRDDVSLTATDESLRIDAGQFSWTPKKLSAGMKAVLQVIAQRQTSEDELLDQVTQLDGATGAIYLYQYLKQLSRLIKYTVSWQGQPFATLTPHVPPSDYQFNTSTIDPEGIYVLSRFAYTRRNESGDLISESPLGRASVILHHPQASALIAALAKPQRACELAMILPNLPEATALAFLNLLVNAQIIYAAESADTLPEAADPALGQWDFADLLFHKQTRVGWKDLPYGGTYHFQGKFDPLPVVKPDLPPDAIPLVKPDLNMLKDSDVPFTAVLEKRRSIREYSDEPITVEQLGEFLYRTARIKRLIDTGEHDAHLSYRLYPAGGALYELEIYPVVASCKGLDAGLYYYNPLEHQLHKVAEKTPYVEHLLAFAYMSANQKSYPQVLLTFAARFQRIQWKYESLPYALILKHVGVLQQTMYLVATAMGLAPCALGGGNADMFARAAGTNYYAETSVGEFLLGNPAKA